MERVTKVILVLSLIVFSIPCSAVLAQTTNGGDINGDGVVNVFDLNTLIKNFGTVQARGPEDVLFWNTNNDIDIYNTNAGNVGIGTVNPSAKVDMKFPQSFNGKYLQITKDGMESNNPVFWITNEASSGIDHLQINGPIHSYVNADISSDPKKIPYLDLGDKNWSWTIGLNANGPSKSNNSWLYWNWVWGQGDYTQVASLDKNGFFNLTGGLSVKGQQSASVPIYIDAPNGQSQDLIQANVAGVNKFKVANDGTVKGKQFITGDILFQKNDQILWQMYEEEDGLYLKSSKTQKTYKIMLQPVDQ